MPPDRRERLGAERIGARGIGPEAEVEQLAVGVPCADGRVGADDRCDPHGVFGAAPERAHRVVDDHRFALEPELTRQLRAQEVEVLRPVGAGQAERGGGEIGR